MRLGKRDKAGQDVAMWAGLERPTDESSEEVWDAWEATVPTPMWLPVPPMSDEHKDIQDALVPADARRLRGHVRVWGPEWPGHMSRRFLFPVHVKGMTDEYGRRTLLLGWPFTGRVLIAWATCYCAWCDASREQTRRLMMDRKVWQSECAEEVVRSGKHLGEVKVEEDGRDWKTLWLRKKYCSACDYCLKHWPGTAEDEPR